MKVKSDNGSPFDCGDFDKYAKYLGFINQHIAPAYPHAIGLVENFNRMIGKVLRTANVEIIDQLNILLQENLLQK